MDTDGRGRSTRAVHAGGAPAEVDGPLVVPIYQSATFFSATEPEGEVRYTRHGSNPNHEALAEKLCALEGAQAALVLSSGNAASALGLLACVRAGEHIVASRRLYGGTLRILDREFPRLDIATSYVDNVEGFTAAIRPNTRALLVELPANPTLSLLDPRPLAALARATGIPLLVDATFATPINFRPLEHGADLVVHSATKYLGGHSDLSAGVVAGRAEVVAEVREKLMSFGPVLDPHATWLLDRGIKTLALRMARHNENGMRIASWLCRHPAVQQVLYPGLPSHPEHELARELFSGFGGVVSVVVEGGDDAALRVMSRLRLMSRAPSLGGVETLVSMPRFTSHAALDAAGRHALGIADGFIRISLGIEDADDLIADLEHALAPDHG